MKEVNVPLGSRRWTPLLERMILEFKSSNPRGLLQLRRWRRSWCVLERGGRQGGATGKVLTKEKAEIFITFARGAEWGFDALSIWKTEIYLNISDHDWN